MQKATVTRTGIFDMQVCVPKDWTDERIEGFAGTSGTSGGWRMRQDGDPALSGDPARQPCDEHPGFVHVMLDAACSTVGS